MFKNDISARFLFSLMLIIGLLYIPAPVFSQQNPELQNLIASKIEEIETKEINQKLEKEKGFPEAHKEQNTGKVIPFFSLGPKRNWTNLLDENIINDFSGSEEYPNINSSFASSLSVFTITSTLPCMATSFT